MCKSELNACFTKVLDPLNANSPLTHGCLDPIANAADVCSSSSSSPSSPSSPSGPSSPSSPRRSDVFAAASAATLDCCHEDMCNYRGLQDLAHTRESAGRGEAPPLADIYVSVKVQNSTLSSWLAPQGRNFWFLLAKRSIFLFLTPNTVCCFAELWAHQRSLFYTPSSHRFHPTVHLLWAWEVGSSLVYLKLLEGDQMSSVLLWCLLGNFTVISTVLEGITERGSLCFSSYNHKRDKKREAEDRELDREVSSGDVSVVSVIWVLSSLLAQMNFWLWVWTRWLTCFCPLSLPLLFFLLLFLCGWWNNGGSSFVEAPHKATDLRSSEF